MKRPSSPAQLALIDLPEPTRGASRPGRRASSWRRAQAAHNARESEELLARLAATTAPIPSASPSAGPHAADRPHPSEAAPHTAIEWRAEALADLFAAVERASRAPVAGNTVRRAAG